MTPSRWPTASVARENGWFSRRHQTPEAHRDANERYKATRGREARRKRAQERQA